MTLATWNVELPISARRRTAMLSHIDGQDADVWVLTETHDTLALDYAFSHSSHGGRDGLHTKEYRWVTIWSRYPLKSVETSDGTRTAAARISPDCGAPFIVYGTVLPWLGNRWRGHVSAGGVAFREALCLQAADWMQIRTDYPEDEFFILGDLNQDFVSPRFYGSWRNRAALAKALDDADLTVLTAGPGDPVRRDSAPRACVDHICARRDSKWRAESAIRWPDTAVPTKWLSDHFGVSIRLVSL